jgi:hypothetical protein
VLSSAGAWVRPFGALSSASGIGTLDYGESRDLEKETSKSRKGNRKTIPNHHSQVVGCEHHLHVLSLTLAHHRASSMREALAGTFVLDLENPSSFQGRRTLCWPEMSGTEDSGKPCLAPLLLQPSRRHRSTQLSCACGPQMEASQIGANQAGQQRCQETGPMY